jgi:hypothetical protein
MHQEYGTPDYSVRTAVGLSSDKPGPRHASPSPVRDGCASVAQESCPGRRGQYRFPARRPDQGCGAPLIVGEDTRRAIPEMICRELDRVLVKGKANAVTIYQPLDQRSPPISHASLGSGIRLGKVSRGKVRGGRNRVCGPRGRASRAKALHDLSRSLRRVLHRATRAGLGRRNEVCRQVRLR